MKKLIAIVLIGVMFVGFGCAPKKKDNPSAGGKTGQTGQSSPLSSNKQQLNDALNGN